MVFNLRNLLFIVPIILFLLFMHCGEYEDGEDGIATLALDVNSDVTSGKIKIWVGVVSGLVDFDRENQYGCIMGLGPSVAEQSNVPELYILTPGESYNHKPGKYEYAFIWKYYDNSDSNFYGGYYTIEINKGEEGSMNMGIFPNDGKDGKDNHYNMIFGSESNSTSISKPTQINAKMSNVLQDRIKVLKQIYPKEK